MNTETKSNIKEKERNEMVIASRQGTLNSHGSNPSPNPTSMSGTTKLNESSGSLSHLSGNKSNTKKNEIEAYQGAIMERNNDESATKSNTEWHQIASSIIHQPLHSAQVVPGASPWENLRNISAASMLQAASKYPSFPNNNNVPPMGTNSSLSDSIPNSSVSNTTTNHKNKRPLESTVGNVPSTKIKQAKVECLKKTNTAPISSNSNVTTIEKLPGKDPKISKTKTNISPPKNVTAPNIKVSFAPTTTMTKATGTITINPKNDSSKSSEKNTTMETATPTSNNKNASGPTMNDKEEGSSNAEGTTSMSSNGTPMSFRNSEGGGIPGHIADPTVVKAVHDILSMLQIYGPLTHNQLEYNLPPLYPSNKLQQILDVLMVTGVINIINEKAEDEKKQNQSAGNNINSNKSNISTKNVTIKSENKLVKESTKSPSTDKNHVNDSTHDTKKKTKDNNIHQNNSSTETSTTTRATDSGEILNENNKINSKKNETNATIFQQTPSSTENVSKTLPDTSSTILLSRKESENDTNPTLNTTTEARIPSKQQEIPAELKKPPRYMYLNGETRTYGDTIVLSQLLPALESARFEILEAQARIKMLKEELKVEPYSMYDFQMSFPHPVRGIDEDIMQAETKDNDSDAKTNKKTETKARKKTGREVLLSMVDKFPSILEDQVYATALKNFNC